MPWDIIFLPRNQFFFSYIYHSKLEQEFQCKLKVRKKKIPTRKSAIFRPRDLKDVFLWYERRLVILAELNAIKQAKTLLKDNMEDLNSETKFLFGETFQKHVKATAKP